MGKYVKHLKVSVHHLGCTSCSLSEKFPEIKLEQASQPTYLKKKEGGIDYQLLWKVQAPDKGELDRYLQAFKHWKGVTNLQVLSRTDLEALILTRVHGSNSSYDKMLKSNVLCSSPVVTENGLEVYNVIATDQAQMRKVLDELSDVGEMKVLRIGDLRETDSQVKLTKKQEEALGLAFAQGYYEWPKKVNLEELAAMSKISRRSLQERLRRAEAKLFPQFLEKALRTKRKKEE